MGRVEAVMVGIDLFSLSAVANILLFLLFVTVLKQKHVARATWSQLWLRQRTVGIA